MNLPAIVTGNKRRAYVQFIEESRGNLVDLLYVCLPCGQQQPALYYDALPWPAYEWPDYSVYCEYCNCLINLAADE